MMSGLRARCIIVSPPSRFCTAAVATAVDTGFGVGLGVASSDDNGGGSAASGELELQEAIPTDSGTARSSPAAARFTAPN